MTTQTTVQTNLINFTLDGKAISVPKGTTVYHAAKEHGIELPIFCYQDRMPPFGACRVCLVEVEKMPKLQTSCTLEATEGMVVKTQSKIAEEGRKGILEFLLINHPLDCPICDRGGECPLQDNTLKYGPGESRFVEEKRHFKKHLPLGPVLMLDRERCIACARCTRFGETIAGDHALQFIERGYRTEVGTPDGGPAKSKFIGNTIMICPVGALTSQVYRFRARPWDNHATKSTCTLCPVGCSLTLDSRDGEVMRTRSHENKDVNDIWLCDKGWFGYEYTDHTDRLQTPLIRRKGQLQPASWEEALTLIANQLKESKQNGRVAAFGGAPLTTEENYLFQKFMREGAGVYNIDYRIGMPIVSAQDSMHAGGMEISIGECEDLSFAVLFGVDLTEEFPVIWLRLRQAINKGAKVFFVGHYAPEIARYFEKTILHAPGRELEALKQHLPEVVALVKNGKKGAFFLGRQYLDTPHRSAIVAELEKAQKNLGNVSLNLLEGHGNSAGARLAGMLPDVGPLGKKVSKPGLNAIQVAEKAAQEGWDYLHIAGANPAVKFPSKLWKEARAKLGFLVVQDLFLTETAQQADVVLPVLSAEEKEGSFINLEGRVQKLLPGKDLPHDVYSDADIFTLLALKMNCLLAVDAEFNEVLKEGVISRRTEKRQTDNATKRAEAQPSSNTASGMLTISFAPVLFDKGVRMQHNPHLVQMVKDPCVRLHPTEGTKRRITNDDRVRVSVGGNTISAKVKLDMNVAEGALVLPLGFAELPVYELSPNLINGLPVEIVKE